MKKNTQLEQFVVLRLQGLSYDEISTKLDVNKTTLIEWAKELNLKEQLNKNQFLKIEALVKQYQLSNEHRITKQLALLNKCYNEIEKRDLSDLPTDKLFNLITTLTEQIKLNVPQIQFTTEAPYEISYNDITVHKLNPIE